VPAMSDLVLIRGSILNPDEPIVGVFWDNSVDFEEWGHLPVVDCTLFWNEGFIPFSYGDISLLSEYHETR